MLRNTACNGESLLRLCSQDRGASTRTNHSLLCIMTIISEALAVMVDQSFVFGLRVEGIRGKERLTIFGDQFCR